MSTRAGKATCGKWGLILLLQQLIQDSLITTESQAGKIKKGNMQTMLSCFSEQGWKYFHININADVMQISLYLEVTLVGYSVTTLRFRSVSCQQNITLTFLYYFYFVL